MLDLLIRGGLIVDGTGNPGYYGAVGIEAERLHVLRGALDGVQAQRTVDATGRVVCPGFIDMHAHSGLVILAEPAHEPKVRQGVTTEVIGIDGCSYAPFPTAADLEQFVEINAGLDGCPLLPGRWTTVEQYLHAEMLSLIVPLVVGYLAVRAVASGLSGAAESGRLDVLLSAPVSRRRLVAAGFAATAAELAGVLAVSIVLTAIGGLLSGAGLDFGAALAGFANVWPLALVFAGLGIVVTGWSLRTNVVTGSVAGVLVAMYVADLIGRLDPSLAWIRYASVFRYYGKAIEDGIDPLAFAGVTAAAVALAALGALLFDRRDLTT
jgi:hypothetical protein